MGWARADCCIAADVGAVMFGGDTKRKALICRTVWEKLVPEPCLVPVAYYWHREVGLGSLRTCSPRNMPRCGCAQGGEVAGLSFLLCAFLKCFLLLREGCVEHPSRSTDVYFQELFLKGAESFCSRGGERVLSTQHFARCCAWKSPGSGRFLGSRKCPGMALGI